MTTKCPRCDTENPSDSKYCKECATLLPSSDRISVSPTRTIETYKGALEEGSPFAGRYHIIEELGKGGMGTVYKAKDMKLKRTVALKFLPPELTRDREAKERFIQEAQAAAAMNHAHISVIYEIDEAKDQTFISMEYIEGQSLKERIESGPMGADEAIEIAIQVGEGLQEAHEQEIVHRDIKPANIMLTEKRQAKIVDFGLAKLASQVKLTRTGATMGTAAYMSPEQVKGGHVDHQTDIWSLGVTLYEMLTEQLPFKGENVQAVMYSVLHEEPVPPSNIRPGIPSELEQIIQKALEKDQKERYQHADEMLSDLRRIRKVIQEPELRASKKEAVPKRKWYASPLTWIFAAILIIGLTGILVLFPGKGISFEKRDWVLIADFENTTENAVFSGALEEALEKELSLSKYVNVVPPERKYDMLRLMQKSAEIVIDDTIAREIALRDGGIRAVLGGSIRQIGETYAITIKVMNPQNGAIVASFDEIARGVDDIFDAIHRLANKVRHKLGESLSEIELNESQIPKEWYDKVTTPHLRALKLHRKSFAYANEFDWNKALLFAKQAIEEDPNFAMAYTAAGFMNFNMGRREEAKKYLQKALALTENLTDREKYFIQGGHALIFGDYEKAIEQYSVLVELYPDDYWSHMNLFDAYLYVGNNQKAYQHIKEAARIRPSDPGTLSAILLLDLSLSDDLKTAEPYYEQIARIAPDFDYPHFQFFKFLKFWVNGDLEAAKKEIREVLNRTQGYWTLTQYGVRMCQLNFDVFRGEFQQAADWAGKTAAKFHEEGIQDIEGDALFQQGLIFKEQRENEKFDHRMHFLLENFPEPISSGATAWLAYHRAQAGRRKEALQFLEQLERGGMNDREKEAFIHLIKGALAQTERKFREAIEHYEEANELVSHLVHPPPYVYDPVLSRVALAEAYEKNNQLDSAIESWREIMAQKLRLFLPNLVADPSVWVKAHYHLGRLYQKKGDFEGAIQLYQEFLELWKDADPGIAEVEDAKKRLAELKSPERN